MRRDIRDISDRLLAWIEHNDFKGWDPHDGLNSPFLKGISKVHRFAGIAALQLVKCSPINLRPLLFVPKSRNAKGMGLVLAASVSRYLRWDDKHDLERAGQIAEWLEENISAGYSGACWGYPFDWPNRVFYAPKGTPTIVNTAFIAHALLDLYEITKDARWLNLSLSSCDFILNDLKRSRGAKGFCFSYTQIDESQTHNANLLGASLLARVGKIADRKDLIDLAMESTSFSIEVQSRDGSWPYGVIWNQKWIDSFHTGYNLTALRLILISVGDEKTIRESVEKGYHYYLNNFFLPDGTVKYYHDRSEPLDAHAFAHAVITLCELSSHFDTPADLATKVLSRMIELFWNEEGYFYWQYDKGCLYRLPCIRWVQSWALLALTTYLKKAKIDQGLES